MYYNQSFNEENFELPNDYEDDYIDDFPDEDDIPDDFLDLDWDDFTRFS